MVEICNKSECVGCGACLSACLQSAITMESDSLGFLYPVINQKRCVDCGLCAKSCFNNSHPLYNEIKSAYVAHAANLDEQQTSTSGGIASVIARHILQCGGVVFGCSGINAYDVKHIRVEEEKDLILLKGSKYVQSRMENTYQKAISDLRTGREVLFIGTPCQVAGLYAFLGKRSFDNLSTMDFVCHGVPSQQILTDAISGCLTGTNTPVELHNRVKEKGRGSRYSLHLTHNGVVVYNEDFPKAGYITGFLCGLYYRENCYNCKFARKERVSDISVGDFWDSTDVVKNLINKKEGLSMVMVNTVRGLSLFQSCYEDIESTIWDVNDFVKRNCQLSAPIHRHPHRDLFASLYASEGFQKAVNVALCDDIKQIKRNQFLGRISKVVYLIPGMRKLYRSLIK